MNVPTKPSIAAIPHRVFFRAIGLSVALLSQSCGVMEAQSPTPAAPAPAGVMLTPQQRVGEGIYLNNCSYCHSTHKAESPATIKGALDNPKNPKGGISIGPPLDKQLAGGNEQMEKFIRSNILQGTPGKMPGFRYTLDAKQVDDLIAYLKSM